MEIIKAISAFLVLAVLTSSLCISGTANAVPEIQVSSVSAAPGETVSVTVDFLNNPGINTFALTIVYDNTYLTLNSVTLNKAVGGQFNYAKRAVWFAGSDTTYNGTFMTLNFTVSSDAPTGEIPISVSFNSGDICNYREENVDFIVSAGKITVVKSTAKRGDINFDGKVNTVDAIAMKLTIVGKQTRTDAADLNFDGKFNVSDTILLKLIIVGKAS